MQGRRCVIPNACEESLPLPRVQRSLTRKGFGMTFVFVVIALANSAYAAEVSAEYLLNVCAFDREGKEIIPGGHNTCESYIAGVMDYHGFTRSLGVSSSYDFCLPKGETLRDIHRHVQDFLLKHRAQYGPFIASPAVMVALNEAYPCPKKSKRAKRR